MEGFQEKKEKVLFCQSLVMYMFILTEIVVCSFLPFIFCDCGTLETLFLSILCVTVGGQKSRLIINVSPSILVIKTACWNQQ